MVYGTLQNFVLLSVWTYAAMSDGRKWSTSENGRLKTNLKIDVLDINLLGFLG